MLSDDTTTIKQHTMTARLPLSTLRPPQPRCRSQRYDHHNHAAALSAATMAARSYLRMIMLQVASKIQYASYIRNNKAIRSHVD